MKFRATSLLVIGLLASQSSFASTFTLPSDGSRLVGQNAVEQIPFLNQQPLENFAVKYHVGLSNMLEANPGIDPWLPQSGTVATFPLQVILPDTVHEGIIINTAEMRLYYYPQGKNAVEIFPVGIGQVGHDTPDHWVTSIQRKKAGPTWTPTPNERAEFAAEGQILPAVVPAGPENPMGLYAMYIGNLFAIHGTNANFGIGLRVSHGCVRLRADDLKKLFNEVPVGTRVELINEPVKATVEPDGSRYVEVHNPLSSNEAEFNTANVSPLHLSQKIESFLRDKQVQPDVVEKALAMRAGLPVQINITK